MSLALYLFAADTSDSRDDRERLALHRDRTPPESDHPEERALVAHVRAGDIAAFKEIYLTHYDALRSVALSMSRTRDDADDAVQQVFTELWERREAWHPYRIGPSLVRAVRHRVLDELRRVRRTEDHAERPEELLQTLGAQSAVALEYEELERVLAAAVAKLPERRRTALLLRALRQMSYAEIGEALEVSEKAAFLLVARAREALEPIRAKFLEIGSPRSREARG